MNRRGYTMLEVLITSVVMVLLVLAAYPTLNTATKRQEQVANMTILEMCMTQGITTAKAPTINTTSTVHIKFSTTPISCQIAEVDGAGVQTVIATFTVANPGRYTLQLTPAVTNNEYVVSVRPPYHFTTPAPPSNFMIVALRNIETPTVYNSTFFNLITGTIQSRSL